METIALPGLPYLFSKVVPKLHRPQQRNKSEFTSRSQVIGTPGAEQWSATAFCLAPADKAEMWAWNAFITACRGSENVFHLPALALPQTSAANPTVTTAVAGNRAVTVSSVANIQPGMFATVQQTDGHARLVTVKSIDGLNVIFEPTLSGAPTIGADFIIDEPYSRMQLPDPDQTLAVIGEAFQLEAEEKL